MILHDITTIVCKYEHKDHSKLSKPNTVVFYYTPRKQSVGVYSDPYVRPFVPPNL